MGTSMIRLMLGEGCCALEAEQTSGKPKAIIFHILMAAPPKRYSHRLLHCMVLRQVHVCLPSLGIECSVQIRHANYCAMMMATRVAVPAICRDARNSLIWVRFRCNIEL